MVNYDGKIFKNDEGLIVRESISACQYHQALQKVKSGELFRVRPGVFASADTLANTMLDIEKLIPGGVLCLYSAWEHYELTTQIPPGFCVAIPRKKKIVLPEFSSIALYYWSDHLLEFGIQKETVHGYSMNVTDLERSVCAAVKYRNKVGLDVCAEIFKAYLRLPQRNIAKLTQYADKLRVASTVQKYLEIGM